MPRRRKQGWSPRLEEYGRLLAEQNPWHADGRVPSEWAKPVRRPLARLLWQRMLADQPRRFELILGPRRVGKTTCMYQTVDSLLAQGVPAGQLWWLRLDHPLLMPFSLGQLVDMVIDASGASPAEPTFLFLDELAYARSWDLWLKTFYDESKPIRLLATSSSTAALKSGRRESGVGRWEEQHLSPYLFNEYLDLVGASIGFAPGSTLADTIEQVISMGSATAGLGDHRRRFMLAGGFPELASLHNIGSEESLLLRSQRILRTDAVERAIYKDIPQAFGIDNPMMLERLVYTLAGQISGILSPKELCQQLADLTQPTFDRYLSYLQDSFLVFTLQNYSRSEGTVQRRGRKLYFVDGAVRNAALQRGTSPLHDPVEAGHLLENLAATHLHALGQQEGTRVYYWKQGNDEVDLVFDHPEKPMAFEIGRSADHSRSGLVRFLEAFPRFDGRTYLVASDGAFQATAKPGGRPGILSIDSFLLAVGAQAGAALDRRFVE